MLPQSKPQVFIASTVYDLRDVRSSLKSFLSDYGLTVRVSEGADFPVQLGAHSYQACLAQVEQSDFVIVLIDSRYGGMVGQDGSNISITRAEFRHALNRGVPVRTFVRREIWDERDRFKKFLAGPNGKLTKSREEAFEWFKKVSGRAFADRVEVHDFIDEICHSPKDNWVQPFHDAGEVLEILKQQLSGILAQLYGQPDLGAAELDLLEPRQNFARVLEASTAKYRTLNGEIESHWYAARAGISPRLAAVATLHRLTRMSRAIYASEMVCAIDEIRSSRGSQLDFYVSDTSIEMLRPDSWQSDEDHRRVLLASHAVARSVRMRRRRYRRVLMVERPGVLASSATAVACLAAVVEFHQRSEIGLGICLRPSVLPAVDPRLLNYYLRPRKLVAVYDFVSGRSAEVLASDAVGRAVLRDLTEMSMRVVESLERKEGGFIVLENMTIDDVLRALIELDPFRSITLVGRATA